MMNRYYLRTPWCRSKTRTHEDLATWVKSEPSTCYEGNIFGIKRKKMFWIMSNPAMFASGWKSAAAACKIWSRFPYRRSYISYHECPWTLLPAYHQQFDKKLFTTLSWSPWTVTLNSQLIFRHRLTSMPKAATFFLYRLGWSSIHHLTSLCLALSEGGYVLCCNNHSILEPFHSLNILLLAIRIICNSVNVRRSHLRTWLVLFHTY